MTCFNLPRTSYIEENHSYKQASENDQKKKPPRRGEIPQEMMQYWGMYIRSVSKSVFLTFTGYKFETLSVLSRPWGECTREEIDARDEEIVNNNAQYCSIARTGMGDISLILVSRICSLFHYHPKTPSRRKLNLLATHTTYSNFGRSCKSNCLVGNRNANLCLSIA